MKNSGAAAESEKLMFQLMHFRTRFNDELPKEKPVSRGR
jgi:hypothetical protein